VIQIFIGSKQTYRMQQNLSRLQENGRFAMSFLAKDIRMAGYWSCIIPSNANNDITGTNDNTATGDSIDNGTDTLTLKGAFVLMPTGTCGSRNIAAESFYTDASSTITYKINAGILQQATNNQNTDFIEGIQDMQILYGVDTDSDGTPNYYVAANNVTNSNWPKVVSIRISLLGVTLDDNLTAHPVPYTYNGVTTTPTDRKIRRVFNTTIALRNRLL
jgi:type IV pilus assembly protein PilW